LLCIHIISQQEDFEMTNQEIARAYYEARIRGNSEEFWEDHVSDNIGYHLPAHTVVGGEFRGKAAVREAIAAIIQRSENTFKSEILDVTSSDCHAAVLVRATARRNGKVLDSRQVHVFEITNQQITEIWIYAYDRYTVDDFWS
jgi:ketosteroid isomerase-like protein